MGGQPSVAEGWICLGLAHGGSEAIKSVGTGGNWLESSSINVEKTSRVPYRKGKECQGLLRESKKRANGGGGGVDVKNGSGGNDGV